MRPRRSTPRCSTSASSKASCAGSRRELLPIETAAPADVRLAYRIRSRNSAQWDRLAETQERLCTLRLAFARLEPELYSPAASLTPDSRKAFRRLVARANVPTRLEAFSDRLEACEDLYEGAVDRVTDFRWFRSGNRLEIAIVILLAFEAILLILDLLHRSRAL